MGGGRNMPLLTELWKCFGMRFYKDIAPDGAENRAPAVPGRRRGRGGFFLIKFLAGAKSKV